MSFFFCNYVSSQLKELETTAASMEGEGVMFAKYFKDKKECSYSKSLEPLVYTK